MDWRIGKGLNFERERVAKRMIYIGIAAGIFLLDGWIKGYIEKTKREGEVTEGLRGLLRFKKYHNRGAFLNLGENRHGLVKGISVLLCILLTAAFIVTLGQKGSGTLKFGLSLLLGGSFSNTYDRLRKKYVVDYFSIHINNRAGKGLSKVVFNISDFCIVIGAVIAVWKTV